MVANLLPQDGIRGGKTLVRQRISYQQPLFLRITHSIIITSHIFRVRCARVTKDKKCVKLLYFFSLAGVVAPLANDLCVIFLISWTLFVKCIFAFSDNKPLYLWYIFKGNRTEGYSRAPAVCCIFVLVPFVFKHMINRCVLITVNVKCTRLFYCRTENRTEQ